MIKNTSKGILLIFLFLAQIPAAYSTSQTDSLLRELSQTIENRGIYIQQKQDRIERLKNVLQEADLSRPGQFNIYNKLHDEYRTFKYDSAFAYAVKLQKSARQLKDPAKIIYARMKLSHTLLSSGMYKEAFDSLHIIKSEPLPDSVKADYYALMARTYYDLAAYTQDPYYTPRYIETGERYADSALTFLAPYTLEFHAIRGMKLEIGQEEKARADFQMILDQLNPSLNQYAMAANSLGNIHYKRGNVEKGINMMARAAIADIKASVREGVALMTLAEFLYHNGDERRAYDFIKQALEDAEIYGAKQRKIQVAAILPVIEGERLATVESQRSRLLVYAIAVSLLSLLVVIFVFIIFKQLKQLRQAKRIVTEANIKLQDANDKLQKTNAILQETNGKLLEANTIKEEYIGYSFNMYTEYLEKIDKFKKSIHRKLMARKYDEIGHVLDSVNLKKERENLYQGFDKIFLKLFPNFIPVFNSYFKEEDKFIPKDMELLNLEVRIFALLRLGIHDHEQIARIMEYSVRTIYNYKTRVKNRSVLSNEEFEQRIMEIKAF